MGKKKLKENMERIFLTFAEAQEVPFKRSMSISSAL